MNELPPGWTEAQLESLGDIRLGKMLDKSKNRGAPRRYLRNVNVRWFRFDLGDLQTLLLAPDELNVLSIQDGDLLICEGGEPGRCAVWRQGANDLTYQKALHRVRFRGDAIPEYFMYQLATDAAAGRLKDAFTGTTIKHLTGESLKKYPVRVAPTAEQRRIVEKLQALFRRVDSCRDRLQHVSSILKRFREAVLEAAVSGSLTEEWRIEKCGSQSLDTWQNVTIGDVAEVGTGSTPLRSRSDFYAPDGIPWVTSASTAQPVVTSGTEFVTPAAIRAHRLRIYPKGTLLVAMYGEGKTRGQVTELALGATVNQACAAIQVNEERAHRGFIRLVLEGAYARMRKLAEGGNQPNLNLSKIKSFGISLPPLEEQTQIVLRIRDSMRSLESLHRSCASIRRQVEKLTPALLAKAFRGRLVLQDAREEPAREMLESIKARRNAVQETGKREANLVVRSRGRGRSGLTDRKGREKRGRKRA